MGAAEGPTGNGHHQSRKNMTAMVDGALDRIRREVALQREKSNSMCRLQTAHNWAEEKERIDYDDPHISFFLESSHSQCFDFPNFGPRLCWFDRRS